MTQKKRIYFNMTLPPSTDMAGLTTAIGGILRVRNVKGELPPETADLSKLVDHPIEESRRSLETDLYRLSTTLGQMNCMGPIELISAKTNNVTLSLIMEHEEVPPNVIPIE